MKKHIVTLVGFLFAAFPLLAQPSATHYAALDGKSGAALFDAAHSAAGKGYHSLGYDGLYNAYKQTDSRDGKIWDMYSDCSFPYTKKCGNYSKECDCYNREHSVPKSWWGGGTGNQGCDIFIVVPTDGKVNGMRSSYPYGEVGTATYTSANGSKLGNSSMSGYSGKVFEPVDEYKGDFARGILGAMVKWKGSWTQGNNAMFNGNYTVSGNFGLNAYGVALLLKWHREDPVSKKERDRNNGIENTQGNRNPFIDYPCLAEYIWGTHKGESFDLSQVVSSYDASFGSGDQSGCSCSTEPRLTQPAQGETVNVGSVLLGNTVAKTVTLRGANLTQTLSLTLSGADSRFFSVSPASVTASQAMEGQPVAVIYTPAEEGSHSAQLTIASSEFASVVLTVTGKATKEGDKPEQPDGDYVKLMKAPADYAGTYLLVYEDGKVCLDASGSVTKTPNTKQVEITDNTIAATSEIDASAVEIVAVDGGYALRLPSGDYMGSGSTKGNITLYDDPQANTVSVLNGTATVTAANGTALRYNTSAHCFRYYSSGQQSIALFRKTSSGNTSDDRIESDGVVCRIVEGRLTVESVLPATVAIYDVMGRLLDESIGVTSYEKTLPQGFYLLRVGGSTQRVLVP